MNNTDQTWFSFSEALNVGRAFNIIGTCASLDKGVSFFVARGISLQVLQHNLLVCLSQGPPMLLSCTSTRICDPFARPHHRKQKKRRCVASVWNRTVCALPSLFGVFQTWNESCHQFENCKFSYALKGNTTDFWLQNSNASWAWII